MTRRLGIVAIGAVMLTSCSEAWPDNGVTWIEDRLPHANARFDCYESSWNERANVEAPPASALDGEVCSIDPNMALWSANETAVKAVGRCEAAGNVYEFSVIKFGSNHYYDGHYCSRAGAPIGTELPNVGEMTIGGTAMDTDFAPLLRAEPAD